MRYIKTIDDKTVEYSGIFPGDTAMRADNWIPYSGNLPPERLHAAADGVITELPEPERIAPQIRYSKLAVIRTLGVQWPVLREQLTRQGLLDEFFAADYLTSDDPVFAASLAALRANMPECENLLAACVWED